MRKKRFVSEVQLAELANKLRKESGKSMASVARELGVSRSVIFHAENTPEKSLRKIRIALVERYSKCVVTGPFYCLEKKC